MSELTAEAIAKIAELATAGVSAEEVAPEQFDALREVMVPAGYQLQRIDNSHLSPRPRRSAGRAILLDSASYVAYVKRYMTRDTVTFADLSQRQIQTIFNYAEAASTDGPGAPGWADWSATLTLAYSPAWAEWYPKATRADAWFRQLDFAYWIEQHTLDIDTPDGSTLLGIVRDLKISRDVRYERVTHLPTGTSAKLIFNVEHRAVGGGEIDLPESITLNVPIFEGSANEMVPVWVRYKLDDDGQAWFRFEMGADIKRLIDMRFREVLDAVQEATGVPAWLGSPA